MLQILAECKPEILCHLFNKILFSSEFPEHWITGMLLPVHKKGSKSSPKNYRGIMLLSCLGKLFTSLLNERLLNYTMSNNILAREQIGFLKGNRTSDNLIILHLLIHKRFIKRKKLFACFIDFENSFDRVPRELLISKLQKCGINGHFLRVLQSMYKNDKACIKLENKIIETFPIKIGVKQGDNPNPTQFNLYLHDLPELFRHDSTDPVLMKDNLPIGSLLWADDLILFSNSEEGLRAALAKSATYCDSNQLSKNISKTKYTVFNKDNRTHKRKFFFKKKRLNS